MTQYIGQITIILEAGTSERACETLRCFATQLDDTHPEIIFADHNGDIEDCGEVERECGETSSARAEAGFPLLTMLLGSLEKCAALLADYDEHPGEEGTAYRDAIAAIARANAARVRPESSAPDIGEQRLLEALESLADQADEDCPVECRSRHFIAALEAARTIVARARTTQGKS